MKQLFFAVMVMTAAAFINQGKALAEETQYKDVQIGISDAFIPGGFDSNTDAYVVASGIFPNGCYRWKNADVNNTDLFTHEVKSFASVSQGMCIMVLVPFTKEVRLGKLATGKHTLKFMNGDGTYLVKSFQVE